MTTRTDDIRFLVAEVRKAFERDRLPPPPVDVLITAAVDAIDYRGGHHAPRPLGTYVGLAYMLSLHDGARRNIANAAHIADVEDKRARKFMSFVNERRKAMEEAGHYPPASVLA